jgi:hypothetical protein
MTGLLALWLVMRHDADRRAREDSDPELLGTMLGVLLLPVIVVALMPYFVWVWFRDAGKGRLEASVWTAVALWSVAAFAVLAGVWWAVAWAFVVGLWSLVVIGLRAARRKRDSEEGVTTDWIS